MRLSLFFEDLKSAYGAEIDDLQAGMLRQQGEQGVGSGPAGEEQRHFAAKRGPENKSQSRQHGERDAWRQIQAQRSDQGR